LTDPHACAKLIGVSSRNVCPLCGRAKARRACPALGRDICAVCCGTKRLSEIACPPDCGYLTSARAHPPAVVQRRQEQDLRFLAPLVDELSPQQSQLFLYVQAFLKRYAPGQLPALVDEDVANAAAAVAGTIETRAKGVIYEHQASTVPAQRLASELRAALDALLRENAAAVPAARLERDMAAALRQVERAARTAASALREEEGDATPTRYLALVARLMREAPADGAPGADHRSPAVEPASRLIVP
jgi:hypothetical protein